MADTCIVCLGDLCVRRSASPPIKDEHGTLDHHVPSADLASKATANTPPEVGEDEYIAHILPCGHNLHDSCLRPWVERANSCPICRATFNMVELRHTLHGPTVNSYPVQDKTQKAETDHPLLTEDGGDDSDLESIQPCMVCETFGDESQLLLCDGCNQSCHVFCAGLDNIPPGSWFCYDCQSDPELWCQSERRTVRRANEQRARGARRQTRRANGLTTWARLWRSVATRTNIDLDFPFGDEEPEDGHTAQPNRREFRDWQRRFQVAARAAGPGAANRFREIAAVSSEQPAAESQEEIKAWNAYEKARIILEDNEPRGRKRKSRSATPVDERPPEPERKRKRPRTLRVQDGDVSTDVPVPIVAESSRAPLRNPSIAAPQPTIDATDSNGGPTFLQSLLEEVEANPSATRRTELYYDVNGEYFPFGSERSASPECSLPNSGQGTPRSMTPPPLRPVSPTVPTSHIAPIFPPPPDFAQHSISLSDSIERARSRQRAHLSMRSPDSSPTRASDLAIPSSPSSSTPTTPKPAPTHQLGSRAKGEVQSLVKKALKPPYRAKVIDAKQFTEINKTICHRLYEEIGSEDNLADKEKWQQMASDQVSEALAGLKSDSPNKTDPEGEATLPIRESN